MLGDRLELGLSIFLTLTKVLDLLVCFTSGMQEIYVSLEKALGRNVRKSLVLLMIIYLIKHFGNTCNKQIKRKKCCVVRKR